MSRFDSKIMSANIQLMKTEMKLPTIKPSNDIQSIIDNITNGKMNGISAYDLYGYASKLSVYSLYIKGEINSLKSKLDWLEGNIKNIVGKNIRNVEGYGYNEKESFIRANDEIASELDAQSLATKAKINILWGIDEKIHYLSNIIQNVAKERSYSRNNL